MEVIFKVETAHTRREGSTKKFVPGKVYTLSTDYAQEFIDKGVAAEALPVTIDDLKPKRNKKSNQ